MKKSTGWVGDISKYSYNVNKIKKLIKLKKLNSSNTAISTTIKQIKISRNDNNKESIESKFYRRGGLILKNFIHLIRAVL